MDRALIFQSELKLLDPMVGKHLSSAGLKLLDFIVSFEMSSICAWQETNSAPQGGCVQFHFSSSTNGNKIDDPEGTFSWHSSFTDQCFSSLILFVAVKQSLMTHRKRLLSHLHLYNCPTQWVLLSHSQSQVHLCICQIHPTIHPSIHLSIRPSILLSTHPSTQTQLPIHPPIQSPIHQPTNPKAEGLRIQIQ